MVSYSQELLLDVSSPQDNNVVATQTVTVGGRSSPDATVSVNGHLALLDPTGQFNVSLPLTEGPNLIEVIASDLAGNVEERLLTLATSSSGQSLFGTVTNITVISPGIIRITLDTTSEGVQSVETTANTILEVPGKENATAGSISVGDFLAIWAETSDSTLEARSILVRPVAPVIHAHIIGLAVDVDAVQASFMDRHGNLVSVDLDPPPPVILADQLMTAIVRQDVKTGRLTLLRTEGADSNINRLERALEEVIDTATTSNRSNLEERLKSDVTGIITSLQEISNRIGADQALEQSRSKYDRVLAAKGLETHTVEVTGVIESVDPDGTLVVVMPEEGPSVELNVTDETQVSVFGRAARGQNLELGHQLEARYKPLNFDIPTGQAEAISAFLPSLPQDLVSSLMVQLQNSQIQGRITHSDSSSITVRLANGEAVDLDIIQETQVKLDEETASVSQLDPVLLVTVTYDSASKEALTIDQANERPGHDFISGVVTVFVPKIQPAVIIPGNKKVPDFLVSTVDGGVATLSVTDNTVVEVEGKRVSIEAIKVRDFVRPSSRYDISTSEVKRLILNSPGLRGTVRGRYAAPSGRSYVTVSTDDFKLITVAVPDAVLVLKGNQEVDFTDLKPGERVVFRASALTVRPPKTVESSGVVTAVDKSRGVVTITPAVGAQVALLVPNKPGIVVVDGEAASVEGVDEGDLVELVFYSPENKIVVRIIVRSQ